jgi:eukaryotic-like serine/threonine-protein kinase
MAVLSRHRMTPERLGQIQELYHLALDREPDARAAFLSQACHGDDELRREVESLLEQNGANPGDVMEKPAMEIAADLLATGELNPGAQLGPYRIEGMLGAGGMGCVYKARDTRLGRFVAIKVARARFSERFRREARAISALNHPNICTLYDVGPNYLVMELVEGPTLADRIKKGLIPLEETLGLTRQIADGLAAAHEEGVIHRDLKPANIKIKPDGVVKVLDFGLAKQSRGCEGADDSTVTLTGAGSIMGTAAYMSPEQARGEDADKRADIWAFGAVLYEMVTGRRLWKGESTTEILASLIKEEPDIERAPVRLRRLLRRCLEKDPRKRLRDIGDVWELLESGAEGPAQAKARPTIAALLIAVAALLVLSGFLYLRKPPPAPAVVSRFQFSLPEGQSFTLGGGRHVVAISPDGTRLAYVANQQLYLRAMDALDARPIHGTDEDPMEPVFSPDGQWLAYFVPAAGNPAHALATPWVLKKIAIAGGAPVTLGQLPTAPYGADWRGTTIAFGVDTVTFAGIQAILDSGGALQTLVAADRTKELAMQPRLLDDGTHIIFVSELFADGQRRIVAQALDGKERRTLIEDGSDPHVLPAGQLAFIRRGTLMAAPFGGDPSAVTGGTIPLVEGIQEVEMGGQFAISGDGTLLFVPGGPAAGPPQRRLVWVDRQGHEEVIPAKPHAYRYPRLSPDSGRIAVDSVDVENNIWVFDLGKDTLSRVTFEPLYDRHPIWTPDGKYLLFDRRSNATTVNSSPLPFNGTVRGDTFRQAADGTGAPEPLTRNAQGGYPLVVSPDGKWLVFQRDGPGLFLLPLDAAGEARPLSPDPKVQWFEADISPDGRWIAYDSAESGREEIYVRPFPTADSGRWQISSEGGRSPVWARSGRELFFLGAGPKMVAVPVQAGSNFTFGKAQPLFDAGGYSFPGNSRSFDVSADGKRFLMLKDVAQEKTTAPARPSIVVVSHWLEEVKARMPARR